MIRRRSLLPLLPALGARWHCTLRPAPSRRAVLTLTMIGSADQNPDAVRQARAGRGAHLPAHRRRRSSSAATCSR